MVFGRFLLLFSGLALLAGCGNNMKTKDKVQEAIVARLQSRSGLDLKSIDVDTTSVRFDKNLAYATVAFHPKGDPSVKSGMTMNYTLEDQNGKWVVVNVGGMSTHQSSGNSALPPGHPAVSGGSNMPMPSQGANGQNQ